MPKPKQPTNTKPGEYGKHRTCSQCNVAESEAIQIIDFVLPPYHGRQRMCRSCLQIAIDSSIEKNRAKQRDSI